MKKQRTQEQLEDPKLKRFSDNKYMATLRMKVTNGGVSDQIHDNIMVRIDNKNFKIPTKMSHGEHL